jgi:hypothetical protein
MTENKPTENKNAAKGSPPKVIWDDSNMRMSYANVVNATSTREEVTLFFGVNKTWNSSEQEFHVALTDRIVVNPYAAKRLVTLLNGVLTEYEKRYGALEVETGGTPARNQ